MGTMMGPAKKLRMPSDERRAALFEAALHYESEVTGRGDSDLIVGAVLEAYLPPAGSFARPLVEAVLLDEASLYRSLRDVMAWLTAGVDFAVRQPGYLPILDYGLGLIQTRNAQLDTKHPSLPHMRGKLESIVQTVERAAGKATGEEGLALTSMARDGRDLLTRLDEGAGPVLAYAYASYARRAYNVAGGSQDMTSYLTDVFTVLAEDGTQTPGDTPSQISQWAEVLESTTRDW